MQAKTDPRNTFTITEEAINVRTRIAAIAITDKLPTVFLFIQH
jgi:hypothetical protein